MFPSNVYKCSQSLIPVKWMILYFLLNISTKRLQRIKYDKLWRKLVLWKDVALWIFSPKTDPFSKLFTNLYMNAVMIKICQKGFQLLDFAWNVYHSTKMKFSIKDFFSKRDQIRRFIFTGHIYWRINGKLHFLCS